MATVAGKSGGVQVVKELTLRGIILGALITLVFTAANVYLGLKIGLTFATSIPAAVISMAVLRFFSDSTIQENNIVQTIASAAGTLSAIIFVLPGLIMVGWWTGFPYWLSVAVIAIGGILGVMYSVPLRRALVTGTDLPYPEGVAAAEVLKVGAGVGGAEENKRGLRMIVWSSIAAAGYAALAQTKILAADAAKAFKFGSGATAVSTSLSMALIGVGHLVGLAVGIAMFVGLMISWVFLVPHYTALSTAGAGMRHRRLRRRQSSATRCASSAPARSASRPSGPCSGSSGRSSPESVPRWLRIALARRDAAMSFRSPSATFRSASSAGPSCLSMIPIALLLYAFANTAPICRANRA